MPRVLFICSQNKRRSLSAEVHFAEYAEFEVASAGLNKDSRSQVTPELVRWADTIFVMEQTHRAKLSKRFRAHLNKQRVVCLNIADKYEFMDPSLIEELERKVKIYL